jgi:hypothetical protein
MGVTVNLCRQDNVIARKVAGEAILVPIRGNMADMQKLFILEGIGEFVWERLDGRATLGEIRDAVVKEFQVTAEQAEKDIEAFVSELRAADLVSEAG